MAKYGAIFNAATIEKEDTLTVYGLILVDDVALSSPELKANYIDVPGMDGSIDASEAPQGYPVYQNRTLSFSLYKDVDDEALTVLRTKLMTKYHGKLTTLSMPFEDDHCFSGRFQFGALDSSKRGIIPVSGTVYPYMLRIGKTSITIDLTTSYQKLMLQNEGRASVPVVTVSANTIVSYAGQEYELTVDTAGTAQEFQLPELTIPASSDGDSRVTAIWYVKLKAASDNNTMGILYQEGHL